MMASQRSISLQEKAYCRDYLSGEGAFAALQRMTTLIEPRFERLFGRSFRSNPPKIGPEQRRILKWCEFPQFFPQVWKSLGRDQTRISPTGDEESEGRRL